MAIIGSEPCPKCQEMGHDRRGNHLMIFEDGNKYCNKKWHHKDGEVYWEAEDGTSPILDREVDGTIKFTPKQFKELESSGKLDNPDVRHLALCGMRGADRWEVSNTLERQKMMEDVEYDKQFFDQLKIRNLVTRYIHGLVAKLYNVRCGATEDESVDVAYRNDFRHYYPVYDRATMEWRGAKIREYPKDFRKCLGHTWGDLALFGMQTIQEVLDSGEHMHTLTISGGECDAMAAQQMICNSRKGGKYEGRLAHSWSPSKGEKALEQIIANKETINKFKRILIACDNDETGLAFAKEVSKLFPSKTFKVVMPAGCKDPNDCIKYGKEKEFMHAWFNPESCMFKGSLKPVSEWRDSAKVITKMGASWGWKAMDSMTFGRREYWLGVLGAGTGVGKTRVTKELVQYIIAEHKEPTCVIYLEEPPAQTAKSFAGMRTGKDFTIPPCNDPADPDYSVARDYDQEMLDAEVDALCDAGMLYIADLDGRKDADSVIEVMQEAMSLGYKNFVVDNLTAFTHKVDGKNATGAVAIDETMKRLGSFKDENPVSILLLAHLSKLSAMSGRVPYNEGGEVYEGDFRGAGTITMWANAVFSAERHTTHANPVIKFTTLMRAIKLRENAVWNGRTFLLRQDEATGRLKQVNFTVRSLSELDEEDNGREFDMGDKPATPKTEPGELANPEAEY